MWWGLGCLLFGFFCGFLYAAIFKMGETKHHFIEQKIQCPKCGFILDTGDKKGGRSDYCSS